MVNLYTQRWGDSDLLMDHHARTSYHILFCRPVVLWVTAAFLWFLTSIPTAHWSVNPRDGFASVMLMLTFSKSSSLRRHVKMHWVAANDELTQKAIEDNNNNKMTGEYNHWRANYHYRQEGQRTKFSPKNSRLQSSNNVGTKFTVWWMCTSQSIYLSPEVASHSTSTEEEPQTVGPGKTEVICPLGSDKQAVV